MIGEASGPMEEPMSEPGLPEGEQAAGSTGPVDPVAVGPGDPAELPAVLVTSPAAGHTDGDASLLALVDRLAAILDRSDLGELEVAAGGTTIVLRAPSAIERQVAIATTPADGGSALPPDVSPAAVSGPAPAVPAAGGPSRPAVRAPLTGIYYGAPSPGATPYVSVGDHVAVGQLIGLIEAMKLFNEIKSDLAGRVVRICADNGALVKAKQPLIEVEPA
jgi:acetyl-CoA carboxylase biotin carboxyl carrier protein